MRRAMQVGAVQAGMMQVQTGQVGTIEAGVAQVGIGAVRVYQWTVRPFIGSHCRFWPGCSEYAIEALRLHGAARGTAMAAKRILRCNPWHEGGVDLVPTFKGPVPDFKGPGPDFRKPAPNFEGHGVDQDMGH